MSSDFDDTSLGHTPTGPLGARLREIGLTSPDPLALATFYDEVMCARARRLDDARWVCEGPARRIVIARGVANHLAYAAYAFDSVDGFNRLRARLALQKVETFPFAAVGLLPDAVSVQDPDGNRIVLGVAAESQPNPAHASTGPDCELPARLQHVVIASRNPQRILSFYGEKLGFRLSDRVEDETGDLRTAFLRTDSEHHSFAVFKAPSDRFDHFCLEAGDWGLIRRWADHFASRRIPLTWGPGRHGPGNNVFMFIHDPDGNWVEISAELEVVADDRPAGVWPQEARTLNLWGSALLRS